MGVDPQKGQALGEGLGNPRQEAHTVDVTDNAVTLCWPAVAARRAETTLRYTIEEPNRIDLAVSVRAEAGYGAYEVLLGGYYNPLLRPFAYLARDRFELTDEPGRFSDDAELVSLEVNAAFRGGILIFPRDAAGARAFSDGQWESVARFSPVRRYKVP